MNNDSIYAWYSISNLGLFLINKTTLENIKLHNQEQMRQLNLLIPSHSSILSSELLGNTLKKTFKEAEESIIEILEPLLLK